MDNQGEINIMDEPMDMKQDTKPTVKDENVTCIICLSGTSASRGFTVGGEIYCSRECSRARTSMASKKNSKVKNGVGGRVSRTFDWGNYLDTNKYGAVQVSSFKHCFLSDVWHNICAGMKVEVPLTKTQSGQADDTVYWIATVTKLAGYKVKLRYEGYGTDGSADFWMTICSADVHSVGWSAINGRKLVPPLAIATSQSNWKDYLLQRITGSSTLPSDFYTQFVSAVGKHKFCKGMMLEVVDKMCIAAMKVSRIIETIDCRLHLQYEGGISSDSNDFWCHKNSTLIHPVGWSATVGHRLHASSDYLQSALKKSQSGKYDPDDCTPDMFDTTSESQSIGFRMGMKLEAIDPLNLSTVCVATIMKVLKNNYLMIGIDGCMDTRHGNDWFCYHATSPCILPVGFCEINEIKLTPPKGFQDTIFKWQDYLQKTRSQAAPVNLFAMTIPQHSFRSGLKLEAVDLMDPRLICVATVVQVVGRLLRLHFDGWEDSFDQWVGCESPDIYPVGWCELMKYSIEGPKRTSQSENKISKQR